MENPIVFDRNAALAKLDGDRELFADLVCLFLEESPKELAAARAALARQDGSALSSAAHKLKGSVMQFCAHPLSESVKRLESMARCGDLASAAALCETIDRQLIDLHGVLRREIARDQAA
jgi:HPt (histidine-containing phosphotransfer) domain-containing protein